MSVEDWKEIVRGAEVKVGREKQKFYAICDIVEIKAEQLARRMGRTRQWLRAPEAKGGKQPWESRHVVECINRKLYELEEQQRAVRRAERDLERLRERWLGGDPA